MSGMTSGRAGALLAAAGLLALLANGDANAQPVDPAIDLQLFEAAIGPNSFLTVSDAEVSPRRQLGVNFLVTYLTDPLVVYDYDDSSGSLEGERTAVVEDLIAGQLGAVYGLTPRLQLGAMLPLVFRMS